MGAAGGHGSNKNFDAKDEQVFPDLASAGKILEKQQKQVMYRAAPKKQLDLREACPSKAAGTKSKGNTGCCGCTAAPAMKKKPKKKKKDLPTFKVS